MGIFSHCKQTMYMQQGESIEMQGVWGLRKGSLRSQKRLLEVQGSKELYKASLAPM